MKKNILRVLFIFFTSLIYSQNSLEGVVLNLFNQPIDKVSILNKNTQESTYSNKEGVFKLSKVSKGDSLEFHHVSYQTQIEVLKKTMASLRITMSDQTVSLEEVLITPKINALQVFADVDLQAQPVNSSQEVLRKVPGLFIGQHAGGGKAEQIFLRGFDIDHGTDIALTVDGLPVNMVSHAHGQGYADLHFVIPETLNKIDFAKGPYTQDKGNFSTAGYVDFKTKEHIDHNLLQLEAGQFDTFRLLGMFNLVNDTKHNAYIATEFLSSDGAFESPQNFSRTNLFGKYTGRLSSTDKVSVMLSYFTSKWDASGQIPERAVANGSISRFGAIDDTEGGNTSRTNLVVHHDKKLANDSSLKTDVYISNYDFELYSNFTFFLDDPVNADQIRQKENRSIYGIHTTYNRPFSTEKIKGDWQAGLSLRNDQSNDNELSHTANRQQTLQNIQLGAINETNLGVYFGTNLIFDKWTLNPSIRLDYFDFQYYDQLADSYRTLSENKAIVSPKFNILYNPNNELQLYFKSGKSFHSNDSRVATTQSNQETLPAAYGFDLGYIWKPTSKVLLNMAYWYLYLEQEFVYVGDAGIVEPSGKTGRQGFDLSCRYQPLSWLFWNLDLNYTHARAIDEPSGQDYIPLAPEFTWVSGLNILSKSSKFYGGINMRHLGDRAANEDNSIVAKGYTITDLNAGYNWKQVSLGIEIENLFNTSWNETQFATESRLETEADAIEEIHFTPGTPFF